MDINTGNIEIEQTINASPKRVFAALTSGIDIWWGDPYFENEAATKDLILEAKIGGRLYERWSSTGDKHGSLLGIVTAINPPELLRLEGPFGVVSGGVVHSRVTFELKSIESGTLLQFTHHAVGGIDDQWGLKFRQGWQDLLGRLKRLVEDGQAEGIVRDPSLREV